MIGSTSAPSYFCTRCGKHCLPVTYWWRRLDTQSTSPELDGTANQRGFVPFCSIRCLEHYKAKYQDSSDNLTYFVTHFVT